MLTRKALEPSTWCNNCRHALLKAFISSSGLFIRSAFRSQYGNTGSRALGRSRSFITSRPWRSNVVQQRPLQDSFPEEETPNTESPANTETDSSIPWYLQVESPQRISNPLLERQQIPQLSPDAPPLLKPILEHISIDLGLDDLTIFDLRNIDPPPALGANLLMVLGTARSEKHLHVSADRFCRWLKVTHKLSPYADGLLGRGELKLKLRRKARRARLLSNVGSSETGNADDGLRTGWICVTVGIIEDGRNATETYEAEDGYVGFGSEAGGAKVVIQMLTQEKREELDLEDLWGKTLRRYERKEERISSSRDALPSAQEVGLSSSHDEQSKSDLQRSISLRSPKRPTINQSQPHKQAHLRSISSAAVSVSTTAIDDEVVAFRDRLQRLKPVKTTPNDDDVLRTLISHVRYVSDLPWRLAIKVLGQNIRDRDSTTFLRSFYAVYPQSADASHWGCRLALIDRGVYIGHSGYKKQDVYDLSLEMQASLKPPPSNLYFLILRTLLTPSPVKTAKKGWQSLTKESLVNAVMVLNAMLSHGYEIDTERAHYFFKTGLGHAFRAHGKVRSADPDKLKTFFDTLHVQLHRSPSYGACMRILIESCEMLPQATRRKPRADISRKMPSTSQSVNLSIP